jgi:hypothetical protein
MMYCKGLKEVARVYLKYYSSIFLEGLEKTTTELSQESRCPDRDSNQAPPELKSRMLPINKLRMKRVRHKTGMDYG